MMNKYVWVIVVLLLVTSLLFTACSGGNKSEPTTKTSQQTQTATSTPKPTSTQTPTQTSTQTPTATPTPTLEPEPEPTTSSTTSLVPHPVTGAQAECLMCHETGISGAPKIPNDHAGRTNDLCTACHQPGD